jgi:5-methylcytosine-specific restriction endonuclease McrA
MGVRQKAVQQGGSGGATRGRSESRARKLTRKLIQGGGDSIQTQTAGDPNLFWNESNWQALCRRCHNRKTAVSDGRWG